MSKLPSYELEATPWQMGKPKLIGLNATEWWMVFTQIKDEVCFVTDSGYEEPVFSAFNKNFISRRWVGTVITPGADMYRIEAIDKNDSAPGTSPDTKFTRVEKIQ